MPRKVTVQSVISPSADGDILVGTAGVDFLNGEAGNDVLTGGGSSDVFILSAGGGDDTVTDFRAGGAAHDVLTFGGFGNFVGIGERLGADPLADGMRFVTETGHALTVVERGGDTVLEWDTGDSITLVGVSARTLTGDLIYSY